VRRGKERPPLRPPLRGSDLMRGSGAAARGQWVGAGGYPIYPNTMALQARDLPA
jgi:hypothetical protein